MKLLDPKSDVTFKKIFGEHERILIAFLNALLKLPVPIVKVNYLSNELHQDWEEGKNSIVDIRCTDDLGRQFIVEMQMVYFPAFLQRTLFNASKLFSRQLEMGQDFSKLKPTYSINILVKTAFPNSKDYVNIFKITNTKDVEHNIGDIEFIFVELEKWQNLAKFDEENSLDHWLKYFMEPDFYKNLSQEDIKKYGFVTEALQSLELSSYTREELDAHDRYLDQMRTHNAIMRGALEQGLAEGREKGLTEGREQGISEGKEQGISEGREQGISEGREQGITEGIEKGEELAFEKILLLLQDIKTNKIPDAELSSKYNVKETYVAQIRLSTQ